MKKPTDPDEAGQDDFERRMTDVERLPKRDRLVEEAVVRESAAVSA